MIYIRKVNRVNRSLSFIVPPMVAEYLQIEKGDYVKIRMVKTKNGRAIIVKKLKSSEEDEIIEEIEKEEKT